MTRPAWRQSRRVDRLPANWRSVVRPAVFELYGDTCHLCGKPGADTVDHKVPGDDHSLANLRPAHDHPCHRRKSAQEGAQAAYKRRGGSIHRPAESHPGLL